MDDDRGSPYALPTLRKAKGADLDAIRALLEADGLPTGDLEPDLIGGFLIAEFEGRTVGLIGLEIFGTTGLLRSLVVDKGARSSGLGSKLVGALEAAAEAAGIRELWLLTIDAERFFERLGYRIVDRNRVPELIRGTREFRELCPDSAFVMTKALG